MNSFALLLSLLALAAIAAALITVCISRRRTRRTLEHLDQMLDEAMRGEFTESLFDESLLSAVETKLAHYLSASAVSARELAAEKDKIQELIADISHQTKTPVANILLYAQLLAEQELPADSKPCVAALNAQAEKLSFLIAALVKVSRLETGVFQMQPQPAAVAPLLAGVREQLCARAEAAGVALTVVPTAVVACFDGKWTAEALYNIADNAVKYTPRGGSVTLGAVAYDLFVRIDVADTGIGIAEEEQALVFGRFYRSPAVSDREGVGIGLYLARQIVSGQGGYIRLTSEPGQGTVFSVFLPRQDV